MLPFGVLDLAPVCEGEGPREALARSLALARHAEALGYGRYWLAEHHNMPGIASAATAVVIGYIAQGTRTIRVGAGGVMLPNHAPLVIAEQFGTLEALYPGRIDLGLGRAPGTDPLTARALRRDLVSSADHFPADVVELQALLAPAGDARRVRAVPGTGSEVPLWLLGSSLYSAQLAAELGLPFAFASHFAPAALYDALAIYRARFTPSAALSAPHAMACVNVVVADDDATAQRLFTSAQVQRYRLRSGRPGLLPPPVDDLDALWSPPERDAIMASFRDAFVGSPATVREGLAGFLARTRVDEILFTAQIYEQPARLRSFELAAGLLH
ncbi:MAG: LLM class flavin-dependent oxidoreductase [Proteobacteria bacterium]|nr:LLM class flavin-dependent oxidoreductase [Pseudomonadota bacterium]